jgi:hypothetical protein
MIVGTTDIFQLGHCFGQARDINGAGGFGGFHGQDGKRGLQIRQQLQYRLWWTIHRIPSRRVRSTKVDNGSQQQWMLLVLLLCYGHELIQQLQQFVTGCISIPRHRGSIVGARVAAGTHIFGYLCQTIQGGFGACPMRIGTSNGLMDQ